MAFRPGFKPFEDGVKFIEDALSKHRHGTSLTEIVTSQDPLIKDMKADLTSDNVPDKYSKTIVPVVFDKAQFAMIIGEPDADSPAHSHPEQSLRFIIHGSLHYDGKHLTAGDWMFVPGGKSYSVKAGSSGVTTLECYPCCCM